ncbi:Deoxyguanosinetriphosphate triphosphohydrolase [Pseudomonas fluorescens]|uniref:Deoxyguanosinetriphosphate triphosphohydrolase n=1 Tax=Pseudomonas fluorescens TaxID=294 RepID=A0A5E7LPK6_PSEFL|nr:dNTP triphosphohydrolase [Pseudomonas fluorescens]VVM72307.1 Deoxyguanosinetriphosphate triphosphohydrolase [Pseudomonas fluorescens]VVP16020.1 Deoxyguanosinetriphosphate triphosphohydrolase [Pseudomonas fluorescens]
MLMHQDSKWTSLLNENRRKKAAQASDSSAASEPQKDIEYRTQIERDHDRILFCTPVRRMADKTQVFPLDKNDSIRNRLTHSHEVSNLARSLGVTLAYNLQSLLDIPDAKRTVPALLAAVGLVHDLGNPPFGHQGEAAIQSWFRDNKEDLCCDDIPENLYQDFLKFEGNAQTFRLVTRLQLLNDNFGLDLTYATLAAMMKYPTSSMGVDKGAGVARKKHGFFHSEESIAKEVLGEVGLEMGLRHPMAYLMEACDDIAYAVLDAEDAIKKGLASFSDLMAHLKHENSDPLVRNVVLLGEEKHTEYRGAGLSPAELNDVSMQRFRVFAIGEMINAATEAFLKNEKSLVGGTEKLSLLELSRASRLRDSLCDFSRTYAFVHRTVLEVELRGYNTIRGLMDIFWDAIKETDPNKKKDIPKNPYDRYVYTRISESYRRVYNDPADEVKQLPVKYRQFLLLTDMISGMTDSYAMNLLEELTSFKMKVKNA